MKIGRDLQGDINIIPLVDIILVILIVFMITAPLLTTGIDVKLPKTQASAITRKSTEPLVINITKSGRVKVKGKVVSLETLYFWLKEMRQKRGISQVEVAADRGCKYGVVAKVLAVIQKAGIKNIALLTESVKVYEKK